MDRQLLFGISEMYYWIEKFPDDSMIVLNYAEISSVIHEFTLKNENSVSDLWMIIQNLSNKDFENANSSLKIYKQKWDEITKNCSNVKTTSAPEELSNDTMQ